MALAACAPDLPMAPSATGAAPSRAGPLSGGIDRQAVPPALPRPDARVDEEYARRVARQPVIPRPEHVAPPDPPPPGAWPWPPTPRQLQGLDRSPFQGLLDAPIGRAPCPAGMVHCR